MIKERDLRISRCFWISNKVFTVGVECVNVESLRIWKSAPIVRRFVGQPLENLVRWSNKEFGKTEVIEL